MPKKAEGLVFFRTTSYSGLSPKCKFCGSSDTSYSTGFYAPPDARIEAFPPNIIEVECHCCKKTFEVNLVKEGYVKKNDL